MLVRRPAAALAAVTLAAVTLAATVTSPAASAASAARATVGGSLLASTGVVVRPGPSAPALPPTSALPASSWMVSNLTTGQVLAAKDAHGKFLPASTLKTLTAVTLLPRLNRHTLVPVTNADASVDGTRVGLVPGYRYTVAKLFTCMLIFSANDAANTLARANGGIPRTLAEMNAEAHHLQAYDTVAKTPSGLDGVGESTSAYDLALIAQAGLQMSAFRHYIQIVHSTVPAPHHKHFAIYTHNQLLTTYRGDIGGKNGYTVAAEGTYVGAATRGGQTILVTLMHANPDFWPMARDLLNWGFKATGKVTPVGTLVPPLVKPHPTPVAAPLLQLAGHRSGPIISPLDFAIGGVLVVLVGSGFLRRRQLQRRRRRRTRGFRLPLP